MKFRIHTNIAAIVLVSSLMITMSCYQKTEIPIDDITLDSNVDTVSYSIGVGFGSNFTDGGLDTILDLEIIIQGLTDVMSKNELLVNKNTGDKIINKFMSGLLEKRLLREYGKNKEDGENFLTENMTKDSVVTLESGLQYKILKKGIGEKPSVNDKVIIHSHCTLINDTVVNSSILKGKPFNMKVSGYGIIPGLTEALQMMNVGAKWKLFIPHNLGYGTRERRKVDPYSTLIYEIELLSIQKAEIPQY